MGRCHRCAWAEQIRWFTLRNLLRLGRRSGRRQEFTHLLLEKIGQFAATPVLNQRTGYRRQPVVVAI